VAANRLLPSGRVIESPPIQTAAVENKRDRDFTASPGFHALRLAFDLKCLGTTKTASVDNQQKLSQGELTKWDSGHAKDIARSKFLVPSDRPYFFGG